MRFDFVFERFKNYADLDDSEEEKWTNLVYDCIAEIRGMLLPGCDIEMNSHRLTAAAAALAFYKYRCILSARGEAASFKAGDVTLNIDSRSSEYAYKIYNEELSGIADLLKINDFVFGRTESLCTEN